MGISPEKFRTSGVQVSGNSAAEQITLLFIGRIAEKKGLDYLLDAIPAVIREYTNIQVFVCGDGPDKAVCEKKCGFLRIGNYVKFKGRISEQEKIDYLRRADILVIPSIVTVDGDTEGVPVVLLEGLAAGKTIIASRVGGIPEVIKDGYNGILIPEKNSEQISKNILKLISEPGLRTTLSQNAFQSSRLFEWKCIGDQYLYVLKR